MAPILDQAFDAGSLYALRAAMAAHATAAGMALGEADDIVVAVHELAANVVRHGPGHGQLRVWQTHDALRCEVSEDGDGQRAAEVFDVAQWRILPGHGLWLVRQLADQTSLYTGPAGTVVTLVFGMPAGSQRPPFRLTRQTRQGCAILGVAGELDLGTASQLTQAIDDAIGRGVPLVLDLADLASWDSTGLAALITAQQRIGAPPAGRLVIAALPGHLRRRLSEAGIEDRLALAGTTAQAVTLFSR